MISNVWYDNGNRELDSVNGCYYNVTLHPTNYQRSTLDKLFCKRGEKIYRKILNVHLMSILCNVRDQIC